MTLDGTARSALETTMRIRGDANVLETAGSGSAAPVRRFNASPWRDPRLIAGVLIVAFMIERLIGLILTPASAFDPPADPQVAIDERAQSATQLPID